MPRRGECIYKRKDGRWEARYVKGIDTKGRKIYGSVYAKTYRAVKEKQQAYICMPQQKKSQSTNLQVAELMLIWLSYIKQQIKPSSYQKYEGMIYNHILPELGDMPLILLNRKQLEDYAVRQKETGRIDGGSLSTQTVNDILAILNMAFQFAHKEYGLTFPQIPYLRSEKCRTNALSREEQDQLVQYLLAHMDEFHFGVLLALYTGIRLGELCALCWEDIGETELYIHKTMQRLKGEDGKTKVVVGSPKSESSYRHVPLPSFLLPYITEFRKTQGYLLKTDRTMYVEPRLVQIRFQKITKACGLEQVNFHMLRHTFATRCVEVGFDVKTLSEILGHSDVKTTMNRYVHSSFSFKQQNMEKLSMLQA